MLRQAAKLGTVVSAGESESPKFPKRVDLVYRDLSNNEIGSLLVGHYP